MKEKILQLKNEGKSYNEIAKILNCSKSTINYHCSSTGKLKTKERGKKLKEYKYKKRLEQQEKAKQFVNRHKKFVGCSKCGIKNPIVLDYHHLRDKILNVSQLVNRAYSIKTIKKEIRKCIILCANCHRIETWS